MSQELSLVPNSGIQFVTYQFNENDTKLDNVFIERHFKKTLSDGSEHTAWRLLQGWSDNKSEPAPHEARDDDRRYNINLEKALEPFLNRWVPVPYLRAKDSSTGTALRGFDDGPTNWVRVQVTRNEHQITDEDPSHTVVFAFDTKIEDYSPVSRLSRAEQEAADTGEPYNPDTEPTASDIEKRKQFCFMTSMEQLDRFLSDDQTDKLTQSTKDYQQWVVDWLADYFLKFKQTSRGTSFSRDRDIPNKLEHVARWIGLLNLLKTAINPPSVRFFDTLSDKQAYAPVEVDLILDIGNSRTCGMLIEDFPSEDMPGISNTITLGLRDLGRIDQIYVEPFDSHIEFSQASFGDDALSNASGREGSFFWPSIVRVGKEATRLRNGQDDGNESLCGISSPKRYLWDVAEAAQPWRFPKDNYVGDWQPTTFASMRQHLNARGDSRSHIRKEEHDSRGYNLFEKLYGDELRGDARSRPSPYFKYSRSSMYTFMLAELIWQAFVQINNPQARKLRKQSETPRHLRRIVLTLPTAMPAREQMIMQMRAQSAVTLLWELMKWNVAPPPNTDRPQIEVLWDEASCVQMVWLYGEITEKFAGNIKGVFDLLGRPRQFFTADAPPQLGAPLRESLRIASVDIGGGTTDLMITTYFQQENRAITPAQTFRESIRIAGDDVLRAVIERVVIPAFETHLQQMGIGMPINLLRELFRGDKADMPIQQSNRRRNFVHRVLQPAGLAVMAAYENMNEFDYRGSKFHNLRDVIEDFDAIPFHTLEYLAEPVRRATSAEIDWSSLQLGFDFNRTREAVREAMGTVLENMCEAINHFDCDIILISGRPSRLPAITEMMVDSLAASPDRFVAMHRYQPGSWYPFLERNGMRIADPKTTTVVGGTICALADRRIHNFMVYTDKLQMRSTAKYIGTLERNGQLTEANVLFGDENDSRRSAAAATRSFDYFSLMTIGYRQLPYERWTATPLYEVREARGGNPIPKPVSIAVVRDEIETKIDEDPHSPREIMRALLQREGSREGLAIDSAMHQGVDVGGSLRLAFRTMDSNTSYWLDTGTLLNKRG